VVTKSIPPHSLIPLRWQMSEDGQSFVLAYRIGNLGGWKEVPFFQPL